METMKVKVSEWADDLLFLRIRLFCTLIRQLQQFRLHSIPSAGLVYMPIKKDFASAVGQYMKLFGRLRVVPWFEF